MVIGWLDRFGQGINPSLVYRLQVIHQRLEVFLHGLGAHILLNRGLHMFSPIHAGAGRHQLFQKFTYRFASVIIGIVRILMKDVFSDVDMELHQQYIGEGIIIILGGIIIDMGLGAGVAIFFASLRRRRYSLIFGNQLPPFLIEFFLG